MARWENEYLYRKTKTIRIGVSYINDEHASEVDCKSVEQERYGNHGRFKCDRLVIYYEIKSKEMHIKQSNHNNMNDSEKRILVDFIIPNLVKFASLNELTLADPPKWFSDAMMRGKHLRINAMLRKL